MHDNFIKNKKLSFAEGWISIAVNFLLFGLKYWAGVVSGSIAIIADAWHTLSDSLSSIFVLIGARVSEKPPDENHPFGHGRAELIAALLIGIFLAFVAYEFGRESLSRLFERKEAVFGTVAIVVTIISIVSKETLAQFAFWAFRKTGYRSLRADGWHHRTDAISSLLILIGIGIGRIFWWVDGALGLIVAMLIAYSAFNIVRDAIDPLLGKTPTKNTLSDINSICDERGDGQVRAHHFHIHEYGDHAEITFHLVFPKEISLQKAHEVTNSIELDIRSKLNIEATIHMEPEGMEQDYRPEKQRVI